MAVDNQVLLATILVVGLGYYFLKMKPGQQQLTVDDQKSLQRQNINSQIDQVDVIMDEFKEDWSKRGNNAETTPITGDELTLLQGLERNIRRIDKETGRTRAFEGRDFDNYVKRRDNLYQAIDKYKSKFKLGELQKAKNAEVVSMDLGDVVEPGAHKDLFNKAAPPRATAAQVLRRSHSRLSSDYGSLERGRASLSRSNRSTSGLESPRSVSSRAFTPLAGRSISKARSRRASRGISKGQDEFDNAPKQPKRINKDKASDGHVTEGARSAFEAAAPDDNNVADENARNKNQEGRERNGDKSKESATHVGPVKTKSRRWQKI